MKKIFYSLMAAALCACSQSEVDDVVTPPQPENNGLKFTVVDNGFVNEDGTRVTYGDGVSYAATFEEGDQIGVYAITSMGTDNTPAAYKFENKPLTLTNGVWKSSESLDLTDVKVLFAYAPYRSDASVEGDFKPSFTGADGNWAVDNGNMRNAFFVGGNTYNVTDNSTKEKFEAADWMGAAVNLTGTEKTITFNMIHMRGMVELTTHKDVTLEDLTLAIGSDAGTKYHFTPYHIETADKHVYRILTTEYRSVNTIYATIKDINIVKKFKKTPKETSLGAGKCIQVNIAYTPAETITVGAGQSLAAILTEKYGADYATNGKVTTLRLAGELQGTIPTDGNWTNIKNEDSDWATLRSLTTLKSLDMYQLTNTSLPKNWLKGDAAARTALTSLVLPSKLEIIGGDALQVENVTNIDIPATVTEIGTGAFYYYCSKMSIRIPEDSQLTTVGTGTFYNTKAVYTYENDLNVLVLPETLTNIGAGSAFGYVNQLRKVIFKGETAPTILNSDNAFLGTNATIYVPNKANYYGKSLFPGKTVFVGPVLTVDNYRAVDINGLSFTHAGEGSLSALCDGPVDTHWHSDYTYYHDYDQWGIFIDITLPKEYNNLKLSYTSRYNSTGQLPRKVRIGVSADGNTFTETNVYDATALATKAKETKELAISASSPYTKVRFGVIRSQGGGNSYNPETEKGDINNQDENGYYIAENKTQAYVYTALSELTVYEDTWQE